MSVMLFPVFAEYTLKAEDQKAVDAVIEKVQTKPIRTQEVIIRALKNTQNKTKFTEKEKAIFAAVESGLREKTASGDILATSLERKEIVQSLFTQTNQWEKWSATLEASWNISSSEEGDLSFKGSLTADVDIHDKKNPKMRVQIDVFAKDKDIAFDTAGEMRVLDSVGYFLLKKLEITPDDDQLKDFITPYLNMWWKVPLDEASMQDIQTSPQINSSDAEKLKKTLLEKNVIPKLLYVWQKRGVSQYSGVIDNNALVDIVSDIAAAQWEIVLESDKEEAKQALKGVTIKTDFSLDTKKTFSAIAVTTSLKNVIVDTDTINGAITFTLNVSSQARPITAPGNARDISEIEMF